MRKTPFRPGNEISQSFSDGILTVCSVTDAAQPGLKPREVLKPKLSLRYAEQRLGISRYFAGKQNQLQIERVIRVPHTGRVSSQDVAVTEDGEQYRIDLIQKAEGVYPPSEDLTLVRITQKFEVEA